MRLIWEWESKQEAVREVGSKMEKEGKLIAGVSYLLLWAAVVHCWRGTPEESWRPYLRIVPLKPGGLLSTHHQFHVLKFAPAPEILCSSGLCLCFHFFLSCPFFLFLSYASLPSPFLFFGKALRETQSQWPAWQNCSPQLQVESEVAKDMWHRAQKLFAINISYVPGANVCLTRYFFKPGWPICIFQGAWGPNSKPGITHPRRLAACPPRPQHCVRTRM